jgi:hypothetical protein
MAQWVHVDEATINLDQVLWITNNGDGSYTLYFGAGPQGPITTVIDATRGNEILKYLGRQDIFRQPGQGAPGGGAPQQSQSAPPAAT